MGPCTITNSSFTGTVSSKKDAGGILGGGYHAGSAPNSPCVNISDCRVTGEVTGTTSVGGILGAEGKYITQCWDNGIGGILNNEFTGKIHASGKNVGAIIGFMCSMNICNRISNNYYAIDCGAERGMGRWCPHRTAALRRNWSGSHRTAGGAKCPAAGQESSDLLPPDSAYRYSQSSQKCSPLLWMPANP